MKGLNSLFILFLFFMINSCTTSRIPSNNDISHNVQVDYFNGSANCSSVNLNWNKNNNDYSGVRLVRNIDFVPETIADGQVVYEGMSEQYIDSQVQKDYNYYYALFTKDINGNYAEVPLALGSIQVLNNRLCNLNIEDENLLQCLQQNNLAEKPVEEVTSIICYNNYVSSLKGIEIFENLEVLKIDNNYLDDRVGNLNDLTPIANLTTLKEISFVKTKIENISPLKNLINLEKITLGYNKISDLSSLSNLDSEKLTELILYGNEIENISVISKFTKLQKISLYENNVSDPSPLYGLNELTSLNISYNALITNLSFINATNYPNLERLAAIGMKLNNVDFMNNMNKITLKILLLNENNISSFVSLANFTSLENLHLAYNEIDLLPDLSSLSNLKNLYLSNNKINNITNLKDIISLESLFLNNNQISTGITELKTLINAKTIDFSDNLNNICDDFNKLKGLLPTTNILYNNDSCDSEE